jgi:hypothetical protein
MGALFDLFILIAIFGSGFLVGHTYAQLRERRHYESDSVLMIKPPRVFVDEDGRSDFRPELREAADRRRQREVSR